jgi:hypothetical protein
MIHLAEIMIANNKNPLEVFNKRFLEDKRYTLPINL